MADPSDTTGKTDATAEIARLNDLLAKTRTARDADMAAADERMQTLEAMTEVVPVGVVFADETGRIIHGNSAVERLVGHPVIHSPDKDSYQGWTSFHADGRPVELHEYPLSKVIADGADHAALDVQYQKPDGTLFWMRIIGQPVRDDSGALIGATVALIDIDRERKLQAAQEILIAELNHRVKNAFSVTQSIVSRSLKNADIADELNQKIDKRLNAYAKAHATLIGTTWGFAKMDEVAREILEPIASDRVVIEGPDVEMPSRTAIAFSMAFYELATNAVKYGSLSEPDGTVSLTWSLGDVAAGDRPTVELVWRERGGPVPAQPTEKGFGSFVTGRAIMAETNGSAQSLYLPEGLEWHLKMPQPEESEP